jgi:hypothetical protein
MFPSLLVIIPLHGLRVPAEPMVRHAATWLAPRLCPAPPAGSQPRADRSYHHEIVNRT